MNLRFPEDDVATDAAALPEYARAPVVETSIGIQMDALEGYNSIKVASFWDRIKGEFPVVEEHPPLDPAFETFGPGDSQLAAPMFQLLGGLPSPRFFFVSGPSSELVQLQSDRLFVNWRRTTDQPDYPRYARMRALLEQMLAETNAWSQANSVGEIRPTQAESLYINRIPLSDIKGEACGLSHYFPWFHGLPGVTDSGGFGFRRRLLDEEGEPVARLHVNLKYGTNAEQKREAVLSLHVRGRPAVPSIERCLEMIDGQRAIIVRTFTDLTSSDAHALWERTR